MKALIAVALGGFTMLLALSSYAADYRLFVAIGKWTTLMAIAFAVIAVVQYRKHRS